MTNITHIERKKALKVASFAELAALDVPPREWTIDQQIPHKAVSSLYGVGGEGKTLIALQMAEAISKGERFMGSEVTRGPVLLMLNEDDTEEVGRRVQRLKADSPDAHVIDFQSVTDPCLMRFTKEGAEWTHTGTLLELTIAELQPRLVVLDPIGFVFGGNENDRAEVGAFIRALARIAAQHNTAFLMIGHPAKEQASQYSGSTAWTNGIRSRLELKKVEGTEDEYRLFRHKSNYGPKDEDGLHLVKTMDGVFKSAAMFDLKGQKKRKEEQRRTDCDQLAKDFCTHQHKSGGTMPTASTGQTSLYQMLAAVWADHEHPFTAKELAASMIRLTESGFLETEEYRLPSRHKAKRYVIAGVPNE